MPLKFSRGKSGSKPGDGKPAAKPAAKPAPASPATGIYALLNFFSTDSPGCAMIAWVLFMIITTFLVLTVPDDLADPFAMPTPVPILMSAVEVDRLQEACASFYTIQPGDTLASISQKTGLTEYVIVYANPPAQIALPEGYNLCLPNPNTVPTPAPTLVVDSRWSQSRWTTDGSIRLPATGFKPARRTGAAAPAQADANRLHWYLPVVGR